MQHVERKGTKMKSRKNEEETKGGILANCLCNKERKGYRQETGMG